MNDDAYGTLRLIEVILRVLEDVIFPAIALWIAYLIRSWLKGTLQVPPYEHRVELSGGGNTPAAPQTKQ